VAASEWYENGLRFECTQCGRCCTGPPGFVAFTDEEGDAMAAALGLSRAEFDERFVRTVRGIRSLTERRTEHGYDCVFLDRDTVPGRALCRVYEARPTQCRTWPFWGENLASPRAWRRAARDCPGMNHGPLVPVEEIRIRRDSTPDPRSDP